MQFVDTGNQLAGAWYLYDETGRDIWLTFIGTLVNQRLETQLLRFTGPPLGTPWDIDAAQFQPVGNVVVEFQSSTAARLQYDLAGITGVLDLTRF